MSPIPPLYPHRLSGGLVLKPLKKIDAEQFFAFVTNNRAHLERHDPWMTEFQQLGDVQRVLARIQDFYEHGKSLSCGVWDNDQLIGYFICGELQTKAAKTGYGLAEHYQGRGIITRTGRVVLDYAFRVLGMELAWLTCNTDNARSIRTAELLGFKRESKILPPEQEKGIFQTQYKYVRTKPHSRL
jgi:ribosomal-protein-serine acetyltransferase